MNTHETHHHLNRNKRKRVFLILSHKLLIQFQTHLASKTTEFEKKHLADKKILTMPRDIQRKSSNMS